MPSIQRRRPIGLTAVAGVLTLVVAGAARAQELTPIPQANWSVHFVDSQETAGEDGAAANAFDGDPASIWHTRWTGGSAPLPHELQINLGGVYDVAAFRYLPRQNSQNGRIGQYEFYTSTDGTNWGTPAATGTFTDGTAQQQVLFSTRSARYVRLRALSEVAGRPFTAVAELNVLTTTASGPQPIAIPQTAWTLAFVDSQETVGENGAATNAFDGNPNSIWHTQWLGGSPPPPHEIQINLNATYDVVGFRYLPRQSGENGRIANFEFYVSTDGVSWGPAVAAGAFPNNAVERQVLFSSRNARFVRLRALSEVAGRPFTSLAELNVLTTSNVPPDGTIQEPAGNVAIAPGGSVDFRGVGSDPNGNVPLSFRWDFGNGQTSTLADPPAVTYLAAGVYTVTFTVTDSLGQPDPTPATRTVTVGSTADPVPIPQANWTLRFVDSQETVGENGAAVNAFDGNAATIWHTQWLNGSPPLPHELQIDLGFVYAVSGFRYLPRQNSQNGRIAQYEFYTSMDGSAWGSAAAAGVFPDGTAQRQVLFTARNARFVRLRALTEVAGRPFTAVAELNVLTTGNLPPDGVIDAPAGNITIAPGESVDFSGSGSDPDNDLPLTFAWQFGNGQTSPVADPPPVTYATAGVYTVTLTVTDSEGAADPTPATRTVTVEAASGPLLVPRANWSVHFVDSQETVAENGVAANAFDGQAGTHWASRWLNGGPAPPHEIQINMGASYDVTAFRYLPVQSKQSGRVGEYEFYVSADGSTWGAPVASGAFPDVNSGGEREVNFAPKTGRYLRFRALTEVNGADQIFSAIAELNVLRRASAGNQPPVADIASPAVNATIPLGSAIRLTGSGSDPDGSPSALTYRWSISPGSGIADATVAAPGFVHFDRPGTFVVSFTVADALAAVGTATRTITVLPHTAISKATWSLAFVDSQETVGENGAATNAFDGNPSTIWHSKWFQGTDPLPHEIQISLGSIRDVIGFRYLPRQNSANGRIGEYEFYVSDDGVSWGTPVATGVFPNSAAQQQVVFAPKRGQFVRLRALSAAAGASITSVAELDVLEHTCAGPSVRLVYPRSRDLQPSTTLDIVADACLSEPTQGVRLVVDGGPGNGGSQVDLYAPPYAATVAGLSRAEHIVEAFVVNGAGALVSGPATADRSEPVGIGEFLVGMGDGVTLGYSDDRPADDNSLDGRTTWGGYTSILGDALTAATGRPAVVANAGVGGTSSVDGAATITSLLHKYRRAQYVLVNYGHNDFIFHNLPSGRGLSPGMSGYTGSFKHNIQRIIDASRAAGKAVILSKAAPVLPLGTAIDARIQEYNQVMDELAQIPGNGVPVMPADFYSYFATHPSEYANDIEMNGVGYQSMSRIWLQSLCIVISCPNLP